jgi:hypothetical protein
MYLLVFVCSTLCHVLYFVFLALPCPVLSFPSQLASSLAQPACLAMLCSSLSYPALPNLALPCPTFCCPALPCPCAVLCYYYYLLVWTVPTPINKDGRLFVLIYLFILFSPLWRLYLRHTSCATALLVLVMRAVAVGPDECRWSGSGNFCAMSFEFCYFHIFVSLRLLYCFVLFFYAVKNAMLCYVYAIMCCALLIMNLLVQ